MYISGVGLKQFSHPQVYGKAHITLYNVAKLVVEFQVWRYKIQKPELWVGGLLFC